MNYLGIAQKESKQVVTELNKLLSDYQVYYQNLRNFHWNISGQHFFDLHVKFEDLYNEAKVNIDEIAERILTLRQTPLSTLKDYLSTADIEEIKAADPESMVRHILDNHKILIQDMRKTIKEASDSGDEGTVDMVGGFLASIEKKSWMLDAWLA